MRVCELFDRNVETQTSSFLSLSIRMLAGLGLTLFVALPASAQSAHFFCDGLARDIADRQASGGTLQGAARGAAGGSIIGAISGNAGRGAAIGAATGALGGTIRKAETWESIYRREYDNCMRRNGWF